MHPHRVFCVLAIFAVALTQLASAQPSTSTPTRAPNAVGNVPGNNGWAQDEEVRQIVERGVKYISAKQFKNAIQEFTAAAKRYPQDGRLRHLLGFSLFQDEQLGPAWLQFRAAVRLAVNHKPAVRDFLAMWGVFDQQGFLNAGRSTEYITKALGNPDRKLGNESKQVWEYGFMRLQFHDGQLFAVIDPRGLDPESSRPLDALQIQFDNKDRWRLGYRTINRLQSLTEYVPQKESVQKWTELLSVQRLYPSQQKSPERMMQDIKKNLQTANPDIDFKALLVAEGDVLFHWRDKGDAAKKRPPQHEIVRLVAGEKDVHRLAYSRRVAQIPTSDARSWIDLLRSAELVKTSVPVETARK